MNERHKQLLLHVVVAIAVGGLMLLLANELGEPDEAPIPTPASGPEPLPDAEPSPTEEPSTGRAERPDPLRIPLEGRLELDAERVRQTPSIQISFAFPNEWQGSEPRPVRVVSGDGRAISVISSGAVGDGESLAVEIDTRDLTPGPYMIEVKSAEKTPLPLRRFVFEVKSP